MKYMIISDIHGYSNYLKIALDIFNDEKCDKLVLLGDNLYHGPRNKIVDGYNPMECVELLKPYLNKMIKIRGNCEADIDEELLDRNFYDYYLLEDNGIKYFLNHGHLYNEYSDNHNIFADYIVMGHYHIQKDYIKNKIHYLSPGSISLPKEESKHGYMIIENGEYKIFNLLDRKEIKHE